MAPGTTHDTRGPNTPEIQKGAAAANHALLDNLRLTVEHMVEDERNSRARPGSVIVVGRRVPCPNCGQAGHGHH